MSCPYVKGRYFGNTNRALTTLHSALFSTYRNLTPYHCKRSCWSQQTVAWMILPMIPNNVFTTTFVRLWRHVNYQNYYYYCCCYWSFKRCHRIDESRKVWGSVRSGYFACVQWNIGLKCFLIYQLYDSVVRVFFRIWNTGCQQTLGGPFPSPLPSLSPFIPFPSLPPFPLKPGGCCAKVGGINPPEGVWETSWAS